MASRRCRRVPREVAASESAMAWRRVAGTRSRRPMMLMRTPSATQCSVSVSRYSWSKRRMAFTSAGGRFQFAEESAKSVRVWMPRRGAASMMRRATSAPARWPAERGRPREVAQRPLPSEMMATCKPGAGELTRSEDCAPVGVGGREGGIGTTGEATANMNLLSTAFEDSMGYPVSAARKRFLPSFQKTAGAPKPARRGALPCKQLCIVKFARKKVLPLTLARSANQRFHVIQVTLEGLASRSRQSVFRLGCAAFKRFGANNVVSLFELSRVHAQIAIGRFQQGFQLIERKSPIHRERADDAETNMLVDQTIQIRGRRFARRVANGFQNRFPVARTLRTFLTHCR